MNLCNMLDRIYYGVVLYEIIFDKEPYILEWQVNNYEFHGDNVFFPDKFIGCCSFSEYNIGSTIFFSYAEAQTRLNFIMGVKQ